MSDNDEQRRTRNVDAQASLVVAFIALIVSSFTRAGAIVGFVAVVAGIAGVLRAEKIESGMPAALFGIAIGLLAVVWAAASFASQ